MRHDSFWVVGLLILSALTAWGSTSNGEALFLPLLADRTNHDVDFEAGVLLFASGGVLFAHDLESGARRWTVRLTDVIQARPRLSFGRGNFILYNDTGFAVFSKTDGEVRWRHREWRCGALYQADCIGYSGWLVAYYEQATFIYSPERKGYRLPPQMSALGWFSDGNRLFLVRPESDAVHQCYVWHKDTSTLVEQQRLVNEGAWISSNGFLETGKWLQMHLHRKTTTGSRYSPVIYDVETNRSLSIPGTGKSELFHRGGSADGRHIAIYDRVEESLRLMDADSAETLFILRPEGHRILSHAVPYDPDGVLWTLTEDSEANIYAWPLEEGATPRKIVDGRIFVPGEILSIEGEWFLAHTGANSLAAFQLDTREKIVEWPLCLRDVRPVARHISADMKRCMVNFHNPDRVHVYEAGVTEPIFSMSGRGLHMTSDGRRAVVQRQGEGIQVLEINTGMVLAEFPMIDSERTAVSPDGVRIALRNTQELRLAYLTDASGTQVAPLRSTSISDMSFSPDGRKVLLSDVGRAWLYDADTSALLHTFVEPEQFLSVNATRRITRQLRTGISFVNNAIRAVEPYYVRYEDRKMVTPPVKAVFAQDGAVVLTSAVGQVIRAWDVESGRLVRTIRTGLSQTPSSDRRIRNRIVLSNNGAYAFAYNEQGLSKATLIDTTTGKHNRALDLPERFQVKAVTDDGRVFLWVEGMLQVY